MNGNAYGLNLDEMYFFVYDEFIYSNWNKVHQGMKKYQKHGKINPSLKEKQQL